MSPRKPRFAAILGSWVLACVVTAATAVAAGRAGEAGPTSSVTSKRQAERAAHEGPRTLPPFVTQYQDRPHRFQATNCGPAAMTSVAKSLGAIPASESDYAAIDELGAIGHTSEAGTSVEGMGVIARKLGLAFDWIWGTNPRAIGEKIRQGKRLIAGGNALALPWRAAPGIINHYIVIADVTEHGTFVVYDPMDRTPVAHEITESELVAFNMTSTGGGVTIAVDRMN